MCHYEDHYFYCRVCDKVKVSQKLFIQVPCDTGIKAKLKSIEDCPEYEGQRDPIHFTASSQCRSCEAKKEKK